MNVYDLTPKIHSGLGVFPGDTPFQRTVSLDFKTGHGLLLSNITTTLHLGAHADSSSHYHAQGEGVDKRPLHHFIGQAQVIRLQGRRNDRIRLEDVQALKIQAPRVLFFTGTFPNPDQWNSDFMALSPEVIEWLHQQGCVLVGIDTPSVDPEDSKTLESHQALFRAKMSVLEGLVLQNVPEGLYTLLALPLPIENADASPVRALLLEDPHLLTDAASWKFV